MTMVQEQAAYPATSIAPLVIALNRPGTDGEASRVAPGRVLRMWTVLAATDRELHQPPALSPDVLPRLRRALQVVRMELTRSVSAPLAAELTDLLPPQPASPGLDELRVECASLLGWTGGLVQEILDQVELAAAVTAQAAGAAERS